MKINRTFYQNNTLQVAENLLGKIIVREYNKQRLTAMIVETEAYIGKDDSACHAAKGLTQRTEIMFGEAGMAYVYFVYGMHYMLNIVTEEINFPAAVLIRAVEPLSGDDVMINNRNVRGKNISNGPAKLCQALNIDKSLNGWDITKGEKLWLEEHEAVSTFEIAHSPRVGIDYAKEIDRKAPWRFYIKNNPYVSKK